MYAEIIGFVTQFERGTNDDSLRDQIQKPNTSLEIEHDFMQILDLIVNLMLN